MSVTDGAVLTVEELGEYLQVGKNVAYRLVKEPGFPSVRVSKRRIVIPVNLLEKWLEERSSEVLGGGEAQ